MKAIPTGIFGKQGYLIQAIFIIKKGATSAILLEVLQGVNLQVVIAITSLFTLYSSKSNKKSETKVPLFKILAKDYLFLKDIKHFSAVFIFDLDHI